MSQLSLQALQDTARAYEEILVPSLSEPWARKVTTAAGLGPGCRVLDVACGTGVLARTARLRLAAEVSAVIVTPDHR